MELFFEIQQFSAHFRLLDLFIFSLVRRWLFTSRVFLLFIFGSIGASSWNISICTTYLHVIQRWTYFKFELIPQLLNRRHRLCIYGKLVGQITLLLKPATIFFFFIKITSYHVYDIIANAYFSENYMHDLLIMKFSIVCLSIVFNGLNNMIYKGWIKWV